MTVTNEGALRELKALRTTPPYTDAMIMAAKTWTFVPAEVESEPVASTPALTWKSVDSSVLVAGIFRPPTLNGPTLGELPRDVGTASNGTPFPIATVAPLYPPRAQGGGLVLIETTVDSIGRAAQNRVIRSS